MATLFELLFFHLRPICARFSAWLAPEGALEAARGTAPPKELELPEAATASADGEIAVREDGPKEDDAPEEAAEPAAGGQACAPQPYLEAGPQEEEPLPPPPPDRKISLDFTPHSSSSAEFFLPEQTIIILDWDDTMCPSTTCMEKHGLSILGTPPQGEVAEELRELAGEVGKLLEQACELAEKVVIVTNADEGWVKLSCKAWLPSLQPSLARCEVISARSIWEPRGITSPAGWKERTFEDVISRFYSKHQHQSWKNVISIGDAPHEREALNRVVNLSESDLARNCRSKSVKFVVRPTIQQLTREHQSLQGSLQEIVCHNDDLDLHFVADAPESVAPLQPNFANC